MTAQDSAPCRLFEVVLHEPQIPNNTGNIGRTCVATACGLHLIGPLGFDTSEKACRRAGLDYWPRLGVRQYASFDDFLIRARPPRLWLFSTKGQRPYFDADFRLGDAMVFGSETRGLPPALLASHPGRVVSLPMVPGERSLNLATAVCAAVYEGVRQCISRGDAALDQSARILFGSREKAEKSS